MSLNSHSWYHWTWSHWQSCQVSFWFKTNLFKFIQFWTLWSVGNQVDTLCKLLLQIAADIFQFSLTNFCGTASLAFAMLKDLNKLALKVNFWNNLVIVSNHGRTETIHFRKISQTEPHTKNFQATVYKIL